MRIFPRRGDPEEGGVGWMGRKYEDNLISRFAIFDCLSLTCGPGRDSGSQNDTVGESSSWDPLRGALDGQMGPTSVPTSDCVVLIPIQVAGFPLFFVGANQGAKTAEEGKGGGTFVVRIWYMYICRRVAASFFLSRFCSFAAWFVCLRLRVAQWPLSVFVF